MPDVPRINDLRFGFDGAMREHCVVNSAADDTEPCRFLKRPCVFISSKSDYRQPLADISNEQHRLFAADAMPAWHAGQCRVHFGQTVGSAATGVFLELDEETQTCVVMNVVPVEYGHKR